MGRDSPGSNCLADTPSYACFEGRGRGCLRYRCSPSLFCSARYSPSLRYNFNENCYSRYSFEHGGYSDVRYNSIGSQSGSLNLG